MPATAQPKRSLLLSLMLLLGACGGGGTAVDSDPGVKPPPGPIAGCITSVKSGFPQLRGALDWDRDLGGDAIGADSGGADGAGGVGAGGDLGKFVGADVVVTRYDGSGELIGTAATDDTGMVTIRTCGYDGPMLVEFKGNDRATYVQERLDDFDPSRRDVTRFPAGESLRAAVGAVRYNIGVSPFTEAAVSYLEKSILLQPTVLGKSVQGKALPEQIELANQQIAKVIADQLPNAYRPNSDRGAGKFRITQLPTLTDQVQQGALDSDPAGIAGAVNAGFGLLADTFLPSDQEVGGDGKSPSAVIAARQLALDLGDGRLDMTIDDKPVAATAAPAYTYETLWRAKTIGAGRIAEKAGTGSLASTSAQGAVEVAHFGLSSFVTYPSRTGSGSGAAPVLRRTDIGQTVTLDSGGRLKVERRMGAQVGDDRNYFEERHEHDISQILGGAIFVEVKVGSVGEVVALTQDRRSLLYIEPMLPYRVQGDETPDQGRARLRDAVELLERQSLAVGSDALRVVSFVPAPLARTFNGNLQSVPPAITFVGSDGRVRGIVPSARFNAANGERNPFNLRFNGVATIDLPAPALLQALVYDKFAPPGHTARYGPQPAGVTLPWTGPRRLYGLTRAGQVVTWLEGADATGVTLDIPGSVILVNADSSTGVYALNSAGQVFWLNADQAHARDAGAQIDGAAAQPRRYALNQVVPIPMPGGVRICWIGAEQAIDCDSGRAYAWAEPRASLRFAAAGAGGFVSTAADGLATLAVPTDVGAAQAVDFPGSNPGLWRLSAVEHLDFTLAGSTPLAVRLGGLKYLSTAGKSADKATVGAQRNILSDLICDLATGSKSCPLDQQFAYITGAQLRAAIEQSIVASGGSAIGSKESFFPSGYASRFGVVRSAGTGIALTNQVQVPAGDIAASMPATRADGQFVVNGVNTALAFTALQDVTNQRGFALDGAALGFADSDRIRLDRTLKSWRSDSAAAAVLRRTSQFPDGLGSSSHQFYVNLIPGVLVTESFGFRVCWEVRVETFENGNGRKSCTLHDATGKVTGFTVIDARLFGSGAAPRVDFGDAAEEGSFTPIR
ncbi:MAG: hypothetical protein R3E68_09400 [Burkholderiaceae bacterium]